MGPDPERPQDVRTPRTAAEVTTSLKTPGTTLIAPQMGTFLFLHAEAADDILEASSEELNLLLGGRLHTRDGQVLVISSVEGWAEGTIRYRAEAGRITAVPMSTGGPLEVSPALAGQANAFLEQTNKRFTDEGLDVVSVSADLKTGMIKVVTAKRS